MEEAALRLSIELDIALGDKVRFEAHASQYLRRFHKSKFAVVVVSQIANFVAAHDYPANPARRAWLERVANRIAPERRAEIFIVMAELGLRSGKVAMTRYAARLAAASGVDRSLALAYEGAALVINPITAEGLERLAAAEGFSPATSTVELIAAARFVAAIIHAPAEVNLEVVAGSQVAAQSSPTVELAKARTAILNADKLLEETVN